MVQTTTAVAHKNENLMQFHSNITFKEVQGIFFFFFF